MKMPAEEVGWGLTPGSRSLSGLPTDEKQPEIGLVMADRFIHHIPWEHRSKISGGEKDDPGLEKRCADTPTRIHITFLLPL